MAGRTITGGLFASRGSAVLVTASMNVCNTRAPREYPCSLYSIATLSLAEKCVVIEEIHRTLQRWFKQAATQHA